MKNYCFLFLLMLLFSCSKKNVTTYAFQPETIEKETTPSPTKPHYDKPIEVQKPIPINPRKHYVNAFQEIKMMLLQEKYDFKKAVFLTENAWFGDSMSFELFDMEIQRLTNLVKKVADSKTFVYEESDYEEVKLNASIFRVFTDTLLFVEDEFILSIPFAYDFDANDDWTNMFVMKLLTTHKGNCHSMPFLYKMLAIETGAKAYLSFAPHHIYIKSTCKKMGMYNTELTSGEFPTDAWIACEGYVSTEGIQSGIYMDTLSMKQSIAYTLYDLAKGYQRKFGVENGKIMLACLNELLVYYPNCINALLLKATVLTELVKKNQFQQNEIYQEMEKTYTLIHQLGYNDMPEENYQTWMKKLQTHRNNQSEINQIFNSK